MEEKKLYVIGIGPGAREQMTVRADRILRESQVIIGYTVYVDLVKEFYPQAEFLTTPMRQEKERCEMALKAAQDGRKTAMICRGVPGCERGSNSRSDGSAGRRSHSRCTVGA